MQEETVVYIITFLIAQTIAIWKKLSTIEQKIDTMQKRNDEQDKKIKAIVQVLSEKVDGLAQELVKI